MAANRRLRFALDIPWETYLTVYQGGARNVHTRTFQGKTVKFPANVLRPFVTHDGVQGIFELEFDEHNKFVALHRMGNL